MDLKDMLASPDRANIELAIAMEEQFTELEWKTAICQVFNSMTHNKEDDRDHDGDTIHVLKVGLWKASLFVDATHTTGMLELCDKCVSMISISYKDDVYLTLMRYSKQELITYIKHALRWS